MDIYFLALTQNKYNLLPDFKDKLYSEMLNSRQQMLDLSWIYIYLCDKAEAEAFLDEDIIGNIEETSIIELLSVSELISYILDHFSKMHCKNRKKLKLDKQKYKEVICDLEMKYIQAEIIYPHYEGYPHLLTRVMQCLKIYKELAVKEKYKQAQKLQQQIINNINKGKLGPLTIGYNKGMISNMSQEDKQLKEIILSFSNDYEKIIQAIVNGVKFKDQFIFKPFIYQLPSEERKGLDIFKKGCIENGRVYESRTNRQDKYLNDRYSHASLFCGILCKTLFEIPSIDDFINCIVKSELVFPEDKVHLKLALNAFFKKDFYRFIYTIIPNFEKLLRNILRINNLPTFCVQNDREGFQKMYTLTDSLNEIRENDILDEELVFILETKLNNETYENYRNRLAHRLDENLFNDVVAYDLFVLLINTLFYRERNKSEAFKSYRRAPQFSNPGI